MSKTAATTICVGALFMSVLAPSNAVGQWMVNGTTLTGTKALATTSGVDENWLLKAAGVTITCQGSTLSSISPEIGASDTGSAATIDFTECSVNENCKVTKTIGTVPISVEFALDGALAAKATFLPKTKSTFTTVKFEGEQCALLGTQPIVGKVSALAPAGRDETTLQQVVVHVSESSGELKIGSASSELKGIALPRLASGETWSFL